MYLYSVIPIINIPLPHQQIITYYSSEFLQAGCVVNVPLRKQITRAIIIKRYNANEQKQEIKKSNFKLKKIHGIVSKKPIISKDTLLLSIQTSNYYYISTGLILYNILPKLITKNTKELPNLLKKELEAEDATHTTKKQESILKIQNNDHFENPGISIYPSSKLLPQNHNSNTLTDSKNNTLYWINKKNLNSKKFIGAKKYIFFPINDSSSITINRENSGLYESGQRHPKIDSRVIARIKNKKEGVPLISVDSVPSVAMYNFFKKNQYKIEEKKQNIAPLTIIPSLKKSDSITKMLHHQIINLKEDEQAIIFTHRKGLASAILCNFCGHIFKCNDCDTPYVLHKNFMLCHRCMKRKDEVPRYCIYCNSQKIKLLEGGTSAIEEQIKKIAPNLQIKTIDGELIKTQKEKNEIFEKFNDKKYNILIGTKTILNHHHLLPKTKWTAITNLDTLINIPYYNASEEAFLTIWRMREKAIEQSFVQTYTPNIQLFKDAQENTPIPFLENQIQLRKVLGAPPFSQEIQLVYEDNQEYNAKRQSIQLRNTLLKFIKQTNSKNISILGPAPAHQKKKKGYFRWYILLQDKQEDENINFLERNRILSIIPKKWKIIINATTAP